METVEKMRIGLINKILSIKNEEVLRALDKFISTTHNEPGETQLTAEQKEILAISDLDIKNGNLMSHEAMVKRNQEWLNEM